MASKIIVFTLVLSICKVQSQSLGCLSNSQSSSLKGQSSCGCGQSQPQTIQFQPSNNNGVKASPQLQIMPGQNCNLQAIPLSQLLSQAQGSNFQRPQTGTNANKQSIQVTSIPQLPSPRGQCAQPQTSNCNPSVLTAPVSTITIPPTSCTTIIDNSLCNSLANALQMMIANDFINSAISNNIVNQDYSIPVVETSVPGFDLSSFVKNLNANQAQQYQSSCGTIPSCGSDDGVQICDWEQLLEQLQDNQCAPSQPKNADWTAVLNYLNSQNKQPEPEYDISSFISSLKQKGKTAAQITQYPQETQSCNVQYAQSSKGDIDSGVIEALKAYLGNSSGSSCAKAPEVVFPEEIPAQLICNYGYMPTTVPVVSFSVQPVGDSGCNFVVGPQSC